MIMSEVIVKSLAERLQAIEFDKLPISDYNKRYIANLKPALRYFISIYYICISEGLKAKGINAKNLTMVDYGGGSGFLSMLAKEMGIGKVIYIDLNPNSVETVKQLKDRFGIGPDVVLHGDADTLANWCSEEGVKPELLVATDLIEHVYDLRSFFGQLTDISSSLYMVFTTASTPFNPYVKRRLRNMMRSCEIEYLELRREYIAKLYPDMRSDKLEMWAAATRGLIFDDIKIALESDKLPMPADPHNTCDPRCGNWTERILPIGDYRKILAPYGYEIKIGKGYYNEYRSSSLASLVCKVLNMLIRCCGKLGFAISPFITISCSKK